ncbi:unconventional myosin-IXAb isoform X4 [Colossoma macropomum]|nr:unconventional myosin-IXAb isoform X4 [Colossoma macropomum]XP_036432237.1 unconventional myosin-IXAb isoform X4 [Colossoma macropomum]XP_036432238.1 unconventional myosin-IXAb isoform X4 [Colossoma macropomum]XP_036432239.1 unconventional myosin-IXAb isoform X4 [Colossoma macropomum]
MSCHDAGGRRRFEDSEFTLRVYPGALSEGTIYCPVTARKVTSAAEVIEQVIERLRLDRARLYVLAEVKEFGGEEWILNPGDCPVQRMMLWPRMALENRLGSEDYRFLLREKNLDGSIHYGSLQMWLRVTEERRRLVERGLLPQPPAGQYAADLCALPDLNERTLLENLRGRFRQEKIYTYVGGILIVVNPFKFLPIYNPKYVKMYDNHQLGKLEPHIYAVADVAYHAMLQRRRNQCIVISGESGSGKTQSTNFLIHHLTALSQKGFASGVEQIILGAGPVLEAFGNAKTAHNNNSSRFGKFIQVNYQESGTVRGAYVEKYLLEKSRLVYQEHNERNYHVFYYLLAGASEEERKAFHLLQPEEYHYLNQMTKKAHRLHWENYYESELDCFTVEGEDLKHDFERLQLAMEMVGFLPATRKQIFSLLSAILLLGNIRYKKKTYRDDSIDICNPEVLPTISELLEVKEEMLFEALTTRKTVTVGERLIVPYKLAEAGTVRDSMAKSLYGALFDWIVFRTNHALLNNKDLEDSAKILSIGVLDIFGFEDYENNSFEQFCINFANERLQHYFNQHIFKLEQEEYRAEGISWHMIDYIDNTSCINLISKKPTALLHLLDEECNFPQATNQTLLDKFKRQHEGNSYIEFPAVMEPAFIIHHYAGKVKYSVKDFREKNTDHMRPDIVALLKSSKSAFICGLMGIDPVATFRWAVLRAYFRAVVAFRAAGKRHGEKKSGSDSAVQCTVIKSVDSFSFLHHPVHQRSLEILQRCKDDKYNSCITRKNPRSPLSDLQGTNAINEKSTRDGFSGCNGRSSRPGRLSSTGFSHEEDGIFVNAMSSKLLERAQGILMRNKNYKAKLCLPKHLLDVKSLKYLSSLTLHDRITKSLLHLHKKKKPPSISAQFQASLNKLMETLGQSEPYFVKCIRSNAEKLPLRFNDVLVLRQLRYTGMLETVRIRQSGYSVKYTFKDFAHHFHVLLPDGISASQASIQDFLQRVDLDPDGYQVGKTMVFLREAQRQRLQDLLHQEVLRRIVALQRRFRALLERQLFINQRRAARVIQHWWRECMLTHSRERAGVSELQHGAAVCLQAAWRGYRERRLYLLQREAVLLLQRGWRRCMQRRQRAAGLIQATWKAHRQRQRYLQLCRAIVTLQAACRGHQARQRCSRLREEQKCTNEDDEDQNTATESLHNLQNLTDAQRTDKDLKALQQSSEMSQEEQTVEVTESLLSEHSRSLDDSTLKSRAKRESRRKRELEQATFSLELLKVRSNNVPLSDQPVASIENTASLKAVPLHSSPHSSLDSHGSFELLNVDDVELEETDLHHHPDPSLKDESIPMEVNKSESESEKTPVRKLELSSPVHTGQTTSKPLFYISDEGSSPVRPKPQTPSRSKPGRDRKESVVVLISMQKESPIDQSSLEAMERLEQECRPSATHHKSISPGIRVGEAVSNRSTSPPPQAPLDPRLNLGLSSGTATPLGGGAAQKVTSESRTEENMAKIQAQKKAVTHSISISMKEKATSLAFSPKRSRLTFSKSDKDLANQERSMALQRERTSGFRSLKSKEVARGGRPKKARMARTRSDFLTRACSTEADSDDEDDDDYEYTPVLSHTLPLPEPPGSPTADQAFHSDSEMPSQKEQKRLQKTMSSGDLGKVDSLRKSSSHTDSSRVRGKMRFWGKGKHSEKKMSTRGHSADGDLKRNDSPSGSPERSRAQDRVRDSKENREPETRMMMMTMRRRRSLKISSITQEPTAWQNDSLHILSCTADYRSMNDFLMKKINDLETEDSKKDTPVDVVFKKALKEFRLNIFNSYSTALAMDDGRSIRYKDLYALFEHILEKSMRLEQRDWSESPVKVCINTFKVFLDEFMTEYKPMDSTLGKAPKPERKKRRKKETDIVEEHMGHIFKSTQYSIPTYCEYCSSLIWMMDRACVCKLCRYACHRKCCLRMTTKCSKKFDPEQSSRQFGVELSRLTSDERAVPLVVEKLINYIEMHGLYTEGIYRKSGSTNKIKELKMGLDTDANSVNLDDYNIHVIASVLKQWLRDLPNPLLTFELYEEFLRATGLQDKKEVVRGVYTVIDQLSRTHLCTLERLIFHLVRISLQEETNRMSANALAIVFAPCILRCPDSIDPLQSVQDISKTTACVELIICEQMNKYRARLKDINTLEFAESKAKSRLTHIRRSMKPVLIAVRFMSITRTATPGKGRLRRSSHHTPSPPMSPRSPLVTEGEGPDEEGVEPGLSEQQQAAMQQEEKVLTRQIENLQKEKEELTYEMLALEPRASDDEMLESEASIGTADSSENLMAEQEGATSESWEKNCSAIHSRKSESKSRRALRRQPESLDSVDSAVASLSSTSSTPHYRFRSSSSGPLFSSPPGGDHHLLPQQEESEQPVLTTRCASSSEKTRPRSRGNRSCPPKPRESGEGGGRRRETEFGSVQPLVLYGNNEFMV